MTSIVIPLSAPLGFGSRHDNVELRYALRSIEKHLSGYGEIFIIGDKPNWLKNVIHIPAIDDDKTWWKERNIYRKILLACEDGRVTEDFLFMNDDHFLLKDYLAGEFPYYWDGLIKEQALREDQYGTTARNTARAIGVEYFPYYDVHCPILYRKKHFISVGYLDWDVKHGYAIKTTYRALYGHEPLKDFIPGTEYPDLKINQPLNSKQIKELLAGRHWFSIGNKALDVGSGMVGVLEELYPKKSKWEI